jgi:transcription-repair coupling factor (superfamily II helicase)
MEAFAANEYDVLVATTIIESGIDNPHSNTLLIEDSQRLGLAQLYQLKGRVGRSHVKAYAYFLFPRSQSLTDTAVERLTAIGDNTELGSGIKVAMRDLEIRGAGSLLGAEQSGQMSAVGFDLFAQMLTEAVSEARGEPAVAHPEVRVDLPVSAFLPEEYVDAVDERVRIYRRLAGSPSIESIDAVSREMVERFGPAPEAAKNLVDIARVRALAAEAGAKTVSIVRKRITIAPLSLSDERKGQLAARGAIWLEREKKVAVPLGYGESVTHAVLGLLDAILA